jgi:hypothetical protein
LIAATLPMAILQATSTQNDLIASYFFCVLYILCFYTIDMRNGYGYLLCSSLGLGLLTKAHIICGRQGCSFFGIFLLTKFKYQVWKQAVSAIIILLSLNIGYFYRNYMLIGKPLVRVIWKQRQLLK